MKDRVDRDEALARLGAPLLQRDSEALGAECPGADIVAGYLDRTLDLGERTRCTEHFAACARCQGVLAGLARIEAEAPSVQPEESRAGLWSLRLRWQWLAPAAAVLAVGVVWTLVLPTVAPDITPMVQSPLLPSEPPTAAGEGRAAVENETRKGADQPARSDKAAAPLGKLAQPVRMQARAKESPPAPPAARGKRETPAPAAPAIAQNLVVEPSKNVRAKPVPVQKTVDAIKPVAAAAATPTERAVFESQVGAARAGAARVMAAADASQRATIVVSSARTVAWRVGPAGRIEQSVDGRRTWQKQDSGVSANLVAGSAPSETICWVVGQRGTVLRTTDGRTWEAASPPASIDLVSISARDGLVATVVAADGRQFSTIDGGRTWQTP